MVNVWLVIDPREFFSTLITLEKERTFPGSFMRADFICCITVEFQCAKNDCLIRFARN